MQTALKRRLKALKLSQAEFARRVKVHPGTVTRWSSGDSEMPGAAEYVLDLLERLARIKEMADR